MSERQATRPNELLHPPATEATVAQRRRNLEAFGFALIGLAWVVAFGVAVALSMLYDNIHDAVSMLDSDQEALRWALFWCVGALGLAATGVVLGVGMLLRYAAIRDRARLGDGTTDGG